MIGYEYGKHNLARRHRPSASAFRVALLLWCVGFYAGCDANPDSIPFNPFVDLPPIARDGHTQNLRANIVPLGTLSANEVVRIEVTGEAIDEVLVLAADDTLAEAGVYVGGGPPNEPFEHKADRTASYFVFVQFDPLAQDRDRTGTISVEPGDAEYIPPTRQVVRIAFDDGFLTKPGLFDPVDGTDEDLAFLTGISGVVQTEIVTRLRMIFADTLIEIVGPDDAPPAEPFSQITFRADRVLADDQDTEDSALPPADPSRPQCQERVTFGEVLPSGSPRDLGNRILDDEAVVYVGSFQGRGEACWTSAINSVGGVVQTLSQTAAHEIGHLVGLLHVEQIDIMNRSATLAFQRELSLTRGQVQLERVVGDTVVSEVLTAVIQDPARYLAVRE